MIPLPHYLERFESFMDCMMAQDIGIKSLPSWQAVKIYEMAKELYRMDRKPEPEEEPKK